MIRYPTYRSTSRSTNPSTLIGSLCSLEKEYSEIADLRERVREAEAAAAKRLRSVDGRSQPLRRQTPGTLANHYPPRLRARCVFVRKSSRGEPISGRAMRD